MVQINVEKDLASMIAQPEAQRFAGLRYGQGTILTWNPVTFENTVDFRGITLRNLPILGKIDGLSLIAGEVVGLMGWAPNGGFGSWWILGELGVPPLAEPVAVQGGDFIVESGGSVLVRQGGDIVVQDEGDITLEGGTLRAIDDSGVGEFVEIDSVGNGEIRFGTTENNLGAVIRWLHSVVPAIDILQIQSDNSIGVEADGNALLRAGDGSIATVRSAGSGGSVHIEPGGGSGLGDIGTQIGSTTTEINIFYQTTGSAANVHLTGTSVGLLRRSTSGMRYKQDIEDMIIDPASVRKLRARIWRDRGEVAANPDTDRWHVGLVAEEVVEAGLDAFVDFTDEGEPDYVCYDRLAVALLALAQDQERRLADLEVRMNALDGKEPERPTVQQTHVPMRKEDPDVVLPAHDDSVDSRNSDREA